MSIVNVIILWFVAWPVAGFAAWIYILCTPFIACIPGIHATILRIPKHFLIACAGIEEICMKGINWPKNLGVSIREGSSNFGC